MSNIDKTNFIPCGKLIKPHGIKGEIKLFVYNKDSNILKNKISIWIKNNDDFTSFNIDYIKGKNSKIVKLEKIESRDDAELISRKEFFILRSDFPKIESGNFYINDVIKFKVLENGNKLGYIYDIFTLPGGNVMGIKFNEKEILIPMIDKYIEFFDFDKKIVTLKNIKEFLEL